MADINPFEHGPYIQAAAFCEKVLREQDGVLSLIRMVDVISHTEGGESPPQDMPTFQFPLFLVITLKSGRARGRHEITITPEKPSGETLASQPLTVRLEGENRGQNVITRFHMDWDMEGLWWFRIDFDGKLLTRLPLDVRYSRLTTGTASQ